MVPEDVIVSRPARRNLTGRFALNRGAGEANGMRAILTAFLIGMSGAAALAQAPGQMPGTLPPAYVPPPPPPPPVAPTPVPSVVTPLPNPSYGVPRGVTAPTYGGGEPSYRSRVDSGPKKKRPKPKRRPRVSNY
jgi:hypothetical protein